MFENQTLNKNRVLPSAMILDRLSIECIAKAATKEKIYSANPSIENKFEAEKAESAYITIAYLKDKLMF